MYFYAKSDERSGQLWRNMNKTKGNVAGLMTLSWREPSQSCLFIYLLSFWVTFAPIIWTSSGCWEELREGPCVSWLASRQDSSSDCDTFKRKKGDGRQEVRRSEAPFCFCSPPKALQYKILSIPRYHTLEYHVLNPRFVCGQKQQLIPVVLHTYICKRIPS